MAETSPSKKKMDWGFIFLFASILLVVNIASRHVGSYNEVDATGQPTGKKFKYSLFNKKKK